MSAEPLPGIELSTEDWENVFWNNGEKDPYFHLQAPHKTLIKYYSELFGNSKTLRVFVPLCGKSKDLVYLSEQGHEVVGVEYSKIGVEAFFAENDIAFSTMESGDFVIYKSEGDKDITIFQGDFFQLKPELCRQFDVFWDRGSFAAINRTQRNEYADIMFKLMKPTKDSLRSTLGERCNYRVLEDYPTSPPSALQGLDWNICIYLLQPKELSSFYAVFSLDNFNVCVNPMEGSNQPE